MNYQITVHQDGYVPATRILIGCDGGLDEVLDKFEASGLDFEVSEIYAMPERESTEILRAHQILELIMRDPEIRRDN